MLDQQTAVSMETKKSLYDLKDIYPNPYQVRESEDPEHVRKIADSILREGLMQIPTGRLVDGHVQLAFGHTRLAAFRLLLSEGYPQFFYMPVNIVSLIDVQMFEYGLSENLARKELSPIEEARAMQIYRDQFKKTSAEIGKLFNLSESAVRNKLRLVQLPEIVQEKIADGSISEGTARKLMVLEKISPEAVQPMAEKLAGNGYKDPEAISYEIHREICENKQAVIMWDARYKKDSGACGGTGLWPLAWKLKEPRTFKLSELAKIYQGPGEFPYNPPPTPGLNNFGRTFDLRQLVGNATNGDWRKRNGHFVVGAEPVYELIDQLTILTPCTACSSHSAIDGTHYCAIKACWKNRRQAWFEFELERLCTELGIMAYNPDVDGKDYEEAGRYDSSTKVGQYKIWLEEKADHLRLKVDYKDWSEYPVTNSHIVKLISVRDEVKQAAQRQHEKENQRDRENEEREINWKREQKNRDLSREFIIGVAGPIFAQAFASLNAGILTSMLQVLREPLQNAKTTDTLSKRVATAILWSMCDWDQAKKGPAAVAKHLHGVATAWGIQLPKDWLELAKQKKESE